MKATTEEYEDFRRSFNPLIRGFVPKHEGYALLLSAAGTCATDGAASAKDPALRWQFALDEVEDAEILCSVPVDHVLLSITD